MPNTSSSTSPRDCAENLGREDPRPAGRTNHAPQLRARPTWTKRRTPAFSPRPTARLIGNEARGPPAAIVGSSDRAVLVPIYGPRASNSRLLRLFASTHRPALIAALHDRMFTSCVARGAARRGVSHKVCTIGHGPQSAELAWWRRDRVTGAALIRQQAGALTSTAVPGWPPADGCRPIPGDPARLATTTSGWPIARRLVRPRRRCRTGRPGRSGRRCVVGIGSAEPATRCRGRGHRLRRRC